MSQYTGSNNPIDILYHCELHGDTYTTINAKNICKPYFLPCKKCQSNNKMVSAKRTQKTNKNFYYNRLADYCKSHGGYVLEKEWSGAKAQYHFKCENPNHPIFITTADALYSGYHWCPYCAGRAGDFQNELSEICKSMDGELLSKYIDSESYVSVKCNKHNYVWQILPSNIKKGRWCPICRMGFNEKVVWDYLTNMRCNFRIQYSFNDLVGKNNEKLKFDFAVLDSENNLTYLIEVDDEEHRDVHSGDTLRQRQRIAAQERDIIKNNYCKKNQISLYRMNVPFRCFKKWDYDDYYKYINAELKFIVNLARAGGQKC